MFSIREKTVPDLIGHITLAPTMPMVGRKLGAALMSVSVEQGVAGGSPESPPAFVALAHLGHLEEARAELSRMLAIDPKRTIAGFREYADFMAPEVLELYVDGLRLAGLPER